MSLINLLNEQTRENEKQEIRNSGRTLLSGVAVAGTAYYLNKNINLTGGVKKTYGVLKNSSASGNELGAAGRALRSDADELKAILDASKRTSLEKFKTTILSDDKLEELFKQGGDAEGARAFLSALFDSASDELVDDSSSLKASIENLYEGVGKGGTIEENDKNTAIQFYKQNIETSGPRLEAFKRQHSSALKTRGQFDSVMKDFTAEGTSTVSWKSAREDSLSVVGKKKFAELKNMVPGAKNISLVSIDEFGGKAKTSGQLSVYARIQHAGGRYQNVALDLQEHGETGAKIIRGTENLSTRYQTAGGVIDATKLFPELDLKRLSRPGGISADDAIKKATVSLEDHLFQLLRENRTSLQNFSTRNINQYNDYIRSMSIEAPRAMMEGLNETRTVNGKVVSLIDQDLQSAIASSRTLQSNIHKIAGLEHFAAKDREQVTKAILQYTQEGYGGTSGAQTLTSRFVDPFDLNRTRVVGHVESLRTKSGDLTPTAFNLMQRYGHLDRSLLPQTARGSQLHGRPEVATGFDGSTPDSTFGQRSRVKVMQEKAHLAKLVKEEELLESRVASAPNPFWERSKLKKKQKEIAAYKAGIPAGGGIKVSGTGSELIGVTSDAKLGKHARGVNMGAIMLFKGRENTAKLGLAEGMSYMGGTIQVKQDISKTVNREGLGQSKLMTKLLEARRDDTQKFLTIGSTIDGDDFDIDDFFKQFGDSEGRAVLGRQDDRVVHIKKHQGLRRFTLGLSEKSMETNRDRYHIIGKIEQDVSHSKLFSALAKDTTLTISQRSMINKLSSLGLEDVGEAFFDPSRFGGKIANTLLTTTAQVEKSGTYLRTQIHGGMRMLGMDEDILMKQLEATNDGDKLLAEVNSRLKGATITSLDQATVKQREAGTLGKFFETIAERAGKEGISADNFGLVLSLAHDRAVNSKHGMDLEYFQNKIKAGLETAGITGAEADNYLKKTGEMAKQGVVIGAASATAGTPHTNLARNTAKAEPRFANYLYTSLRGFWGMDSKEATGYLSSYMMRMEGFEDRASGLIGMKVAQESLGQASAENIQEQISGLKDVRTMSREEVTNLLELGQGEERQVVSKLSEVKSGNIINLEDMGLSKDALSKLYEQTGGKKEIFLPGEDTFKGFIGHEIKSSQETIKIEAEYGRNVTDLLSSLSGLKDAGEDADQIDSAMKGFATVRKSLSKVAGAAVKHSLSGRVTGSGSYMGGGFTLGKTPGKHMEGTVFSDNLFINAKINRSLTEVVNQEKGYVAFLDQQAFLDGMTKYESALSKHLTQQGSTSVKEESRKLMNQTLKDFFLGMHRAKKTGTSGTTIRNPLMGFAHVWASMGLYQYDFTDKLKPLELLRNKPGQERTDDYKAHLKEVRKLAKQPRVDALLENHEKINTVEKRSNIYDRRDQISTEYEKLQGDELDNYREHRRLLNQEKGEIKQGGYEQYMERKRALYKGEAGDSYSIERDQRKMGVLDRELDNAHNRRLHREGKLIDEIDETRLTKRGVETKLASDEMRELSEQRRLYNAMTSGDPLLKQSPGKLEAVEEELEVLNKLMKKQEKQLNDVRGQLAKDEFNVDYYGRKILGGDDVSLGNVQKSVEEIYEETLHDLGKDFAGERKEKTTMAPGPTGRKIKVPLKVDGVIQYEKDYRYRYFENRDEASHFLNRMGSFFGLNAEGFTSQRSTYQVTQFDKINDALGETFEKEGSANGKTYRANEVERLNTRMGGEGKEKFNRKIERIQYGTYVEDVKGAASTRHARIDINKASKKQLLETLKPSRGKAISSEVADNIIAARKKEKFKSFDDLQSRVKGIGPKAIEANQDRIAFAPKVSRINAFEQLTGVVNPRFGREQVSPEDDFFLNRIRHREIEAELNRMHDPQDKTYGQLHKRDEKIKALQAEQAEIKETLAPIKDLKGEDSLDMKLSEVERLQMEKHPSVKDAAEFTGEKLQGAEYVDKDLRILDEFHGGSVTKGSHLAEIEQKINRGEANADVEDAFGRIFHKMYGAHQEFGEHGGGTIRFPQIELDMDIENKATGVVSKYSGRMDFTRFGIGDYDADPYQVFFDTDKTLRNKISAGHVNPEKMITYGAEFLSSMHVLGEGVEKLGERMGASKLTLAQSLVDEFQKEQIVKGIGGLDVQVKAGMLGLAQAAADDTGGDFGDQFKRIKAGAALISVAQEVLGIKGKKLPIAADISREYMTALKTSFESGEGSAIKSFFQEKIFKGTILEGPDADLSIKMSSVKFNNIAEGDATASFKRGLENVNLSVQEMFDSWDAMSANVKKHNLNKFTSSSGIGNMLESSSRFSHEQLFQLLNRGHSMEGGLITGDIEALQDIFTRAESAKQTLAASISRGKGLAGVIAGGLLASYAIGANQEIGSLEPGAKFSDRTSREALKAGESLSQRAVQQNFSREHKQPSPSRIAGADNFYERPINSGVSTVSLNRSIRMFGEAPNLSAAQSMGKHFVSSGGQASLTINDNRRPIGNAYMNKMMRD
jgi:hypothetical protein